MRLVCDSSVCSRGVNPLKNEALAENINDARAEPKQSYGGNAVSTCIIV